MRKLSAMLLIILAVCVVGFSAVNYSYAGDDTFVGFTPVASGDTVPFETFVYLDGFTYVSGLPDQPIMSYTAVSTSAAATTTVSLTELADVKVSVDFTAGNLMFYFNNAGTVGIPISADWEKVLSTKYFNKFMIVNTATTTDYSVIVERILE